MTTALALPAVTATSLSAGVVVAAVLGAAVLIGGLVVLMRANADAFPLLAVLALPFRLPISAEGRTVNLLIPLYLVVAAGVIAHLLPRLLRREERGLNTLEWLLLASLVLYALQTLYSSDRGKAAENLAFFYVPFALLFVLLRDVDWRRELLLRCLGIAVALAVIFAGIGFVEYARKELFLNPKVVAANQFDNYFRVNSLFFDPNIYGRFLALVMIAVTAVVLWWRNTRGVLWAAAVLAWLLAGLVTSFSQSSIAALLLGLAVLAAYRWSVRWTLYAAGGLVALALLVVLLAPSSAHFGLKGNGGSANNATTGRAKLIEGGLELFADRPLQGFGSGSFQKEYESHSRASVENATSASHTIPITVAAEQGIVGLALYVVLLVVAFLVLFRGASRSPLRIAIAACFAALVLHTFAYADFLEDPLTWTLLGIGVALAGAGDSDGGDSTPGERGAPAAAA
ncbi:MAG TPA: O-antigen ligase family protein [Solirubrobacteraceae bacterium]|jgi:O-antigen ligase|nr:O-antigen ligase family protein [Solirubrobacteraceae bacterium]